MSVVWSTVALVALLLPGFLFFIGIYIPEQFTRETVRRTALGQLAGAVLISGIVHGLLYAGVSGACGGGVPCIRLDYVLAALQFGAPGEIGIRELAANLERFHLWIGAYALASLALGLSAGAGLGKTIVRGRLRFLAQHGWVLDLATRARFAYTIAWIMTHVRRDGRVLMYQGYLEDFGIAANGQFSYVVLTKATRSYMRLSLDRPRTDGERVPIGGSTSTLGPDGASKKSSYLAIEGEDIANAVFDCFEVVDSVVGRNRLKQGLARDLTLWDRALEKAAALWASVTTRLRARALHRPARHDSRAHETPAGERSREEELQPAGMPERRDRVGSDDGRDSASSD